MKKFIGFVFLVLISPASLAEWSAVGVLNEVRVTSGENIYGRLENSNLPCGGNNAFKLKLGLRLESEILSILLTGQTSGKTVSVLFDGSESCEGGSGQFTVISGAKLVN